MRAGCTAEKVDRTMRLRASLTELLTARSRARRSRLSPQKICLRLTNRCNLRCVFCELGQHSRLSHRAPSMDMPLEYIVPLLTFAKTHSLRVFLTGGEPFLYPDLWRLLDFCSNIQMRVSLVTNGTVLKSLSPKQQQLLNDTVAMMSLSLDAADDRNHDLLRGVPGSFAKACAYLRNPRRKHRIALNAVLAPDFANALPLVKFAEQYNLSINFQVINFASNFPHLEAVEWKANVASDLPSRLQRLATLRSAYDYSRRHHVTTNLRMILFYIEEYYRQYEEGQALFCGRLVQHFLCFVPLTTLVVDTTGQLMRCTLVAGEGRITDGDWLAAWQRQAVRFHAEWNAGVRYPACRGCSCHFAENLRTNIAARPLLHARHLRWVLPYYAERVLRGEGRVQ